MAAFGCEAVRLARRRGFGSPAGTRIERFKIFLSNLILINVSPWRGNRSSGGLAHDIAFLWPDGKLVPGIVKECNEVEVIASQQSRKIP
jgi:hypothetical protein